MFKKRTRALSIILATVLMLSTMSCLTVISSAYDNDGTIYLYEEVPLKNTSGGAIEEESFWELTFIPEWSGFYNFYSKVGTYNSGVFDADCELYDEYGDIIDCDYNEGDFSLTTYLEEDCIYTYCVEIIENSANIKEFTVGLDCISIESIEFTQKATPEFVEGLGGHYNKTGNQYYYDFEVCDLFSEGDVATVTYSDGLVKTYTFDGVDFCDDDWNCLELEDCTDQEREPWTLGGENYATVSLGDVEAKIRVEIVEDNVAGFEFNRDLKVTLVENLFGYEEESEPGPDGEVSKFFYYPVDLYLMLGGELFAEGDTVTVTYKDESQKVFTFDGYGFCNEDDEYFELSILDTQYVKPWVLGADNSFSLCRANAQVEVPVEIVEDLVDYVEFVPVEEIKLIEGVDGEYISYPDIFYYDWYEAFLQEGNKVVFHYKDGTEDVYTLTFDDKFEEGFAFVNEDGEALEVIYDYDGQFYEGFWEPGETYQVHIMLSNFYEFSFDVEIADGWEASMYKAPKLTSVSNTSGGVKISWEGLKGATGYYVYYKDGSSWKRVGTTNGTSFVDNTVKSGTARTYTVKAYNDTDGVITCSKYDRTGKTIKFLALTKLTGVKNVGGGVKIEWSKVTGAGGYYVYRKTANSGWTKIGTVKNGSTLTFTDKTAKNGTKYTYTVKAYSGSYYGSYDEKGKTLTYVAAPTPKAKAETNGVKVSWNKITGAKGYYVYRKTTGGWTKIATVTSGSTLSYTDKSAKSGTTYTYTVRAYGDNGTSGYYSGSKLLFLATPKLTKVTAQSGKITVTFGKVTGAKSYNVYRKTSTGSWTKIGTTTSGSYTDKTAKKGTTYCYTVRAVNGSYMSNYNSSGLKVKAK